MKKVTTSKILSIALLSTLVLSVFSCSNFLSGRDLKKQIEDELDAANAPYYDITIENGIGGSVSPIGKQNIKRGTEFTLSYSKDSDTQFIEWQFYIDDKLLSKEETTTYLKIENNESELTTVKLIAGDSGKMIIKPLCYERPVILGKSPTETPEGSYRDAKVTVMFSQPMDESSIYYNSEDEIPSGAIALHVDKDDSTSKIYGYTKDGITFFKNIEIKNIETQESILDHFGVPYLETPTRISIPVKKNKEPDAGTQIFVNISKNMCRIIDGKPVTLYKNEKWNYVVNTKTDRDIPIFNSISVKKYNHNQSILTDASSDNELSVSNLKAMFINDNELYIVIKAQDLASGLKNAKMYMQKIYNNNFKSVTESPIEVPLFLTFNIGTNYASVYEGYNDEEAPFKLNLNNKEDGIYKIWFTLTDANDNTAYSYTPIDGSTAEKYFYILKKNSETPDLPLWFLPQTNGVKVKAKNSPLLWSKANVTYSNKTDTSKEQNQTVNLSVTEDGFFAITNLSKESIYDVQLEIEDIFGYKKNIVSQIMTIPAAPKNIKAGLWLENSLPTVCKYPADNTCSAYETYRGVESYIIYGRGVTFTAPPAAEGFTVSYRLYENDKLIQDNINYYNGFNIENYLTTKCKRTLKLTSVLRINGEIIESEKSNAFDFYETKAYGVYAYTIAATDNNIYITCGYMLENDYGNNGIFSNFAYSKNFYEKNSYLASLNSNTINNLDIKNIYTGRKSVYLYRRYDKCQSKNADFYYHMYQYNMDYAHDIFYFNQSKDTTKRDLHFIWDWYE